MNQRSYVTSDKVSNVTRDDHGMAVPSRSQAVAGNDKNNSIMRNHLCLYSITKSRQEAG